VTTARDPNPQALQFSAYEAVLVTVTMRPPLATPWTEDDTFQINVRDEGGDVVLQSGDFTATDLTNGVVKFPLTTDQTGQLDPIGGDSTANPAGGDFTYDCWKTTPGSEKRLAWGPLSVLSQQWQP
jgi:hypothetical protein